MILKNSGIARKVPENLGAPKKVPKIMAHPHVTTCESSLPPPPRDIFHISSTYCSRYL